MCQSIRILLLVLAVDFILCDINVDLKIENGKIKGYTSESRGGRKYAVFEGIPYAEKPERFKVAEAVKNWEGVKVVRDEPKHHCWQKMPGIELMSSEGTEDCLFVNVYTPKPDPGAKMPVMVWVHGGAYIFGGGTDYHPQYFMDEDVVLITFNYRLGAFGFLYNEDDENLPGNLGMKDQVLALQWVKKNVHFFGGDPDSITIFGESAGASSVSYHLLSPQSQGLFHRAILQSGTAFATWGFVPNPKWTAQKFAKSMGCPSEDTKKMVDCLRSKSAEDLVEMSAEQENWGAEMKFHWGPTAEKTQDPAIAFISKNPKELLEKGEIASKVPIIIGLNKNEGACICSAVVLSDDEMMRHLNSNWTELTPSMLYLDSNRGLSSNPHAAAIKLRDFYFQGLDVHPSTEQRLTDMYSDAYFNHAIQRFAQGYSKFAPTYPYLYTYYNQFSVLDLMGYNNYNPPTHTDEFFYLFPYLIVSSPNAPGDESFSKKFVKLWVSFATTGKPQELWGPAQEWPQLDVAKNNMMWYNIDKRTTILGDVFGCRMKFWDDLYANELKPVS